MYVKYVNSMLIMVYNNWHKNIYLHTSVSVPSENGYNYWLRVISSSVRLGL